MFNGDILWWSQGKVLDLFTLLQTISTPPGSRGVRGGADVNERRRQAATPLRDARYFAARVRTAQVITNPTSTDTVAFGCTVTFKRDDGRVQKFRIVGEDEADPKAGSISFVSPVARSLMGRAVVDVAGTSGQELEIIAIS